MKYCCQFHSYSIPVVKQVLLDLLTQEELAQLTLITSKVMRGTEANASNGQAVANALCSFLWEISIASNDTESY
jgi:hypothetical protein